MKSNLTQDIHNIQEFTRGDLEAARHDEKQGGEGESIVDAGTILARLKIIASAKRGMKHQDNQIKKLKDLVDTALEHIAGFEGGDAGETQKHIRRELKKFN